MKTAADVCLAPKMGEQKTRIRLMKVFQQFRLYFHGIILYCDQENVMGWETARCSRLLVGPQLAEQGRRIHLIKVFCQIKVEMTWHHLVLWPGLRKPENAAECETTRWHSLLVSRAASMWRKECYFTTDRTQDVNLLYRVNLDNSRADYG